MNLIYYCAHMVKAFASTNQTIKLSVANIGTADLNVHSKLNTSVNEVAFP